jgi:CcmD family protein
MTKPIFVVVLLALLGGVAHAIEPKEPSPSDAPYVSPDRAKCEVEISKDLGWYAELKLQLKDDVHQDEYATFKRNNQHVIIAYAAIWVLTVGFAVLMWMRQKGLHAELARLKADIDKGSKA